MILRAAAAFDGHRHLGPTEIEITDGRIAAVRPARGRALAGGEGDDSETDLDGEAVPDAVHSP